MVGILTSAMDQPPLPEPPDEGELRHLFNTVYEGVWMVDRHGITTFVNRRMAEMIGCTVDEMIGRAARDFLPPQARSQVREILCRREQGIADTHEIWLPHKNGGGVWCYVSGAPIHDQQGDYIGVMATLKDITVRKQLEMTLEKRVQERTAELAQANRRLQEQIAAREKVEQALRDSESRFRLLAENATDLICRHDVNGLYRYVSPSCRKLFGYEPADLIGHSPYDFFHADDIERVQAAHDHILQGPEPVTVEYRFRRKDGSYIWLETIAKGVRDPETGKLAEIHTTSRDVSGRHEAEDQLRLVKSAVEQIEEMVVITGPQLELPGPRIEYVNPAFCRVAGYRAEEVVGKTPRILQGPRTSREVLNELHERLRHEERFEGETFNYRKDGSEFILHWHIAPLRDRFGHVTRWVAIQRDVTEQRHIEALARQRQAELAHVGRLSTMGEMASGLAHELNQPLAAIAIYVQGCIRRIQQQGMEEQELLEALASVRDQAKRASEIIRRLRNFVRKREPQRTTADLNYLVREVLGLIEPEVQRQQIRIHLELDESLPAVIADSVQIQQVILNLIRNAGEAMETNEPTDRPLTIRTERYGEEDVCIAVRDAGAGMTDEQLNHMFEPFFTTKEGGMGMGLNISQSIAQVNDGRLWAERNPDRGMCFYLSLPVSG